MGIIWWRSACISSANTTGFEDWCLSQEGTTWWVEAFILPRIVLKMTLGILFRNQRLFAHVRAWLDWCGDHSLGRAVGETPTTGRTSRGNTRRIGRCTTPNRAVKSKQFALPISFLPRPWRTKNWPSIWGTHLRYQLRRIFTPSSIPKITLRALSIIPPINWLRGAENCGNSSMKNTGFSI